MFRVGSQHSLPPIVLFVVVFFIGFCHEGFQTFSK